MGIAFIGADRLWPLLDRLAVTVVNATALEPGVTVTGAVVLLYGGDGSRCVRRSSELALGAGASAFLDGDRPAALDVIGVEAILRVVSTTSRVITEVYLHSDEARAAAVDAIEIGVTMTEGAPADATPIPEVEGVNAYIRIDP